MSIAAPPRPLPLTTRLGFFNSFIMWLGTILTALALLWICLYLASASWQFSASDPRVPGVVTESYRPHDKSNTATSTNITYDFRYEVDGKTYEATEISTDYLATGAVNVQYPRHAPEMSRIERINANGGPGWLILPIGFGIVGLFLLYASVVGALYDVRRIRHGIVIDATVVRVAPNYAGHTRVLKFTAADGRAWRLQPAPFLQEGDSLPVFYMPDEPADAVMLDKLDPKIRAYLG